MRRVAGTLALVCILALGSCGFRGDERAIRSLLEDLEAEANQPPAEGLALAVHAASIGDYFTEEVTVDLGRGTTAIQGREMLIGMVARLQPRTAAYEVRLVDVAIELADDAWTAGVALTVSIVPRSPAPGEGPDPREFALTLEKADGSWRIARVTAVQPLR